MKVMRILPPTASPLGPSDLLTTLRAATTPRASRARVESDLRAFLGADDVFLFSSGRAALTLLLRALSANRPGSRVAIPAYTCYSVPAAIVKAGLEPVLVDLDPRTLDFSERSLREVLGRDDLLCVLATHLFGVVSNVDRIRALAGQDVFVVEDAAQAFGVRDADGRLVGTLGDAALFSLGRGKHLTSGSGGIVTVRTRELVASLKDLQVGLPSGGALRGIREWLELVVMSAFVHPWLYWIPSSIAFLGLGTTVYSTQYRLASLSTVGVGALAQWAARLTAANRTRTATAALLHEALGSVIDGCQGPLLRYPVLLPSVAGRARFLEEGIRAGLGVTTMYPGAIHQIPELQERFAGQRYPGAEILASRLATVPTHRFVRGADVSRLRRIYQSAESPANATGSEEAIGAC